MGPIPQDRVRPERPVPTTRMDSPLPQVAKRMFTASGCSRRDAPLKTWIPIPTSKSGAKPLTWQTLEDVTFKDVFIEEMGAYYWKPTFGPKVKALEGKPFYITGYIIPVDVDEDFYVLSRYPYANCFFCGGAGPESVVDLQFKGKSKRAYQTDERLTFVGTFRLNADDIYQMNYILKDAVEFKP